MKIATRVSILLATMLLFASVLTGCSTNNALDTVAAGASAGYVLNNYESVKEKIATEFTFTEEETADLRNFENVLDALYVDVQRLAQDGSMTVKALSGTEIVNTYALAKRAYLGAYDIIIPKVEESDKMMIQYEIEQFDAQARELDAALQRLLESDPKDREVNKAQLFQQAVQVMAALLKVVALV